MADAEIETLTLVQRLRGIATAYRITGNKAAEEYSACTEAVDEIERLRAALEPFAKIADEYDASDAVSERHHKDEGRKWTPTSDGHRTTIFLGQLRRARAALNIQQRPEPK